MTLWASVADTLATEIANGQRRPGDRLPSEADLAARFGVHRHTVRRAVADLSARGLVQSRQGSGVYVRTAQLDYALGRRTRMSQNLMQAGREGARQILTCETRRANAAEAEALDLPPHAQVHAIEGVTLADGLPFAQFRSVFPADRLPDLLPALAEGVSVTEALRRSGVSDYTRAHTRITAKRADPVLAQRLGLKAGDPVLRTISVNVDGGGQPVEYGHTWFAGDRVNLTVAPD